MILSRLLYSILFLALFISVRGQETGEQPTNIIQADIHVVFTNSGISDFTKAGLKFVNPDTNEIIEEYKDFTVPKFDTSANAPGHVDFYFTPEIATAYLELYNTSGEATAWATGCSVAVYSRYLKNEVVVDENLLIETTYMPNYFKLPSRHLITLTDIVPRGTQWHYNYTATPNWFSLKKYLDWDLVFPEEVEPTTLHFLGKQFTIPEGGLDELAFYTLSIKRQFGFIVYINELEVYRYGITGTYPNIKYQSDYPTVSGYQQISLPSRIYNEVQNTYFNTFKEGTNDIAILLVAKEKNSVFDCSVRLMRGASFNRAFDYTPTVEDIDEIANAFDLNVNHASSTACTNSIEFTFNNNRREMITSVDIYAASSYAQAPTAFTLYAKNPEDADWTSLKTVTSYNWENAYEHAKFKVINDNTYNAYRIENIKTSNCNTHIGEIFLSTDYIPHSLPELAYTSTRFTVDLENIPSFPSSTYFTDFQITSVDSSGINPSIILNPETGVITCNPTTAFEGVYHITAMKWDGDPTETTVTISATGCPEDHEVVSIFIRADQLKGEEGRVYELFEGKETTGNVLGYSLFDFSEKYFDYCLPKDTIYTTKFYVGDDSFGWKMEDRYQLSVDNHNFIFYAGGVPYYEDYVTVHFSTAIPFKGTSEWNILTTGAAPEGWNTKAFDASSWTVAKSQEFTTGETTVYVRKEFSIPNLEDYHVLNVRVKYTGGVVAYFNGDKIARFNLAEEFDATTLALKEKTAPVYSTFSIILPTHAAETTKNVIAFEIHLSSASAHDIEFEATGLFSVNDCSILTNSVSSYEANTFSYQENGEKELFDWQMIPYLQHANDDVFTSHIPYEPIRAFAQWSVDNLEEVEFNAFGVIGSQWKRMTDCMYSLDHRAENGIDFTPIKTLYNEDSSASKHSHFIIDDFTLTERTFRLTSHRSCKDSDMQFGELFLEYCVNPSCQTMGDYVSVLNGYKSYLDCPVGYSGYTYRLCTDGVFGEVQGECVYANEMTYGVYNTIMARVNEEINVTPYSLLPFDSFTIEPTLPEGMYFDTTTGTISGSLSSVMTETPYVITGTTNASDDLPGGSVSVTVYLGVMEGVFAVSKDAVVYNAANEVVEKDPEHDSSENYDFYNLDYFTDYFIINQNKAVIIPPFGPYWSYELPEYKKYTAGCTIIGDFSVCNNEVFEVTVTTDFARYRFAPTSCPYDQELVYVEKNVDDLNVHPMCVKKSAESQIVIPSMYDKIYNLFGEEIKNEKFNGAFYEYIVNSPIVPNGEADAAIMDNENRGITTMGYYYTWSSADYQSKMMMNVATGSGKSNLIILRPALTFTDKKKSLIDTTKKDYLSVLSTPAATETITQYASEAALELMEIVYYLKKKEALHLSRAHMAQLTEEYCTQSDCNNVENIISILLNNGVCEEGADLSSCTPYRMSGYAHPPTVDRTTKWVKDQIDANKPVFTLLSLDPNQLQHHSFFSIYPINKAMTGVINYGGVVTGYNSEIENPYWEIMVRRHGVLNNMIKIKMDVSGKNFGRISNNAFTIEEVVN